MKAAGKVEYSCYLVATNFSIIFWINCSFLCSAVGGWFPVNCGRYGGIKSSISLLLFSRYSDLILNSSEVCVSKVSLPGEQDYILFLMI